MAIWEQNGQPGQGVVISGWLRLTLQTWGRTESFWTSPTGFDGTRRDKHFKISTLL
ncbi:MAG TPA: hypothetical protein V6D26_28370 [Stenomitos sp.]